MLLVILGNQLSVLAPQNNIFDLAVVIPHSKFIQLVMHGELTPIDERFQITAESRSAGDVISFSSVGRFSVDLAGRIS